MSDILRDPIWQFIGAVLAIIAILTSVCLYLRQRRHRKLSYTILSQTPLLSMAEEIEDKLQILYEGKPVKQVHLVLVKIINSGMMPITPTEYIRPISLGFGERARILTAEIDETSPNNLDASASIEQKKVVLKPTLLNSGDWVKLKMMITESRDQVTVDGRIVGVKEIREYSKRSFRFFLALAVVGMVFEYIGIIGMIFLATIPFVLVFIGGTAFGITALLWGRGRYRNAS